MNVSDNVHIAMYCIQCISDTDVVNYLQWSYLLTYIFCRFWRAEVYLQLEKFRCRPLLHQWNHQLLIQLFSVDQNRLPYNLYCVELNVTDETHLNLW